MKTLVINASPKGKQSNSFLLTEAFLKGLNKEDSEEISYIDLYSTKLDYCKGCFGCWKVTPGKCVIEDDWEFISGKILESDNIIVSFPLYCFGVPAILKNLMDRLLPFKMPYAGKAASEENPVIMDFRHDFSEKRLVLISTCAHSSTNYVYDSVRKQFDFVVGPGNYLELFCGQGEILKLDKMSAMLGVYLKKVESAGEEFSKNRALSKETVKEIENSIIPERAVEIMMSGYWEDRLKGE